MFTVIVPVDFSPNADLALQYALTIAKRTPLEIIVFHSAEIFIPLDTPTDLIKERHNQMLKEKEHELGIYTQRTKQNTDAYNILTKIDFKEGSSFTFELQNVVLEHKADLVIMGTKGASGLKKVFTGSNTVKALEQIKVPILAVPQNTPLQEIHTIAYASDLTQLNEEVRCIRKIADALDLKTEVFHIYPNYPQWIDPSEDNIREIKKQLISDFPDMKLSLSLVKTVKDNETVEGIRNYIEIVKPDILVMFPSIKNFVDRIFEPSNTEEIAFHSSVPLLSIPQAAI